MQQIAPLVLACEAQTHFRSSLGEKGRPEMRLRFAGYFGSHFTSQPGDSKELTLVFIYFIYLLVTRKILKKDHFEGRQLNST